MRPAHALPPGAQETVAAGRINLKALGAAGNGTTDDSPALAAAITLANARVGGGPVPCIYAPGGTYLIGVASRIPAFAPGVPGCVVGDGPNQTLFNLAPAFSGDLFAWSEAWVVRMAGPYVAGIRINGSPAAPAQQNALVFYDRNDEVLLENIDIQGLPGRALYSGVTKSTGFAYLREARLRGLRFFNDGAPGVPVVEFTSQGPAGGDATNEVRGSQIDIYGSKGPSLVVRNNGGGVIRSLIFDTLRIEGTENGTTAADLLVIGDPVMTGRIAGLTFWNTQLTDPYGGYAAMRLMAADPAAHPFDIDFKGQIGGGAMRPGALGLVITAGRNLRFDFTDIHTSGTNVTIGPAAGGVGRQIEIKGPGGRERGWTWDIAPSSANALLWPVLREADPAAPDAGLGHVTRRTLVATGSAAMRLVGAGATPPGRAGQMAANISIALVARDRTDPANSYAWTMPTAVLTAGGRAGLTLALATATTAATGTGANAHVRATANAATGELDIVFVPPAGPDIWDAFADIASTEIRLAGAP